LHGTRATALDPAFRDGQYGRLGTNEVRQPGILPVVCGAEEPLVGGNVSTVVRVGDTVRRPSGPWTEAVHLLLRHVRSRGFDLAPEPLGIDEHGREILRFIEGSTVGIRHPWPSWAWTDSLLIQAASALRQYHDAVSDFRPAGPLVSRLGKSTLGPGDIVCHNDFAPYNVVHRNGLVGVIDWDIISAAPPAWDLAFLAWQWVPLHNEALARELGAPPVRERARRLELLCETYGGSGVGDLTSLVLTRVAASRDGILARAAAGDPPFVRLFQNGHHEAMGATIDCGLTP
jgi:hypothetical protein